MLYGSIIINKNNEVNVLEYYGFDCFFCCTVISINCILAMEKWLVDIVWSSLPLIKSSVLCALLAELLLNGQSVNWRYYSLDDVQYEPRRQQLRMVGWEGWGRSMECLLAFWNGLKSIYSNTFLGDEIFLFIFQVRESFDVRFTFSIVSILKTFFHPCSITT